MRRVLLLNVSVIAIVGTAVGLYLVYGGPVQPANMQAADELPSLRPRVEGTEESLGGTSSTSKANLTSEANPFVVPPPPPVPPDREVSIKFPDGTTLSVRLRQFVLTAPPVYSNDRLADVYEDLRRAAEDGHVAAARTLYEMLSTCQYAYADEPSLNAALKRLRNEGILVFPESVNAVERVQSVPEGLDTSQLENTLIRPYKLCLGISEEQKAEASRWAEIAVNGGDMVAMRKRAQELRRQGREQESFEIREELWRRGDASAAVSLSIHYQDKTSSQGGNIDHVRAYAFTLIWNKVYEAASENSASPAHASRLAADESALRAIGAHLTPQEQEVAEALAVQLLAENTNCCIGRWH